MIEKIRFEEDKITTLDDRDNIELFIFGDSIDDQTDPKHSQLKK